HRARRACRAYQAAATKEAPHLAQITGVDNDDSGHFHLAALMLAAGSSFELVPAAFEPSEIALLLLPKRLEFLGGSVCHQDGNEFSTTQHREPHPSNGFVFPIGVRYIASVASWPRCRSSNASRGIFQLPCPSTPPPPLVCASIGVRDSMRRRSSS